MGQGRMYGLKTKMIQSYSIYTEMDILLEGSEELQREIYHRVADLLNLEVDLLFFDTTSTYMEIEEEDEEGLRGYGHSKDRRTDLPQVVIGLVVTKEGIPVRCWVLPGNRSDMKTVHYSLFYNCRTRGKHIFCFMYKSHSGGWGSNPLPSTI